MTEQNSKLRLHYIHHIAPLLFALAVFGLLTAFFYHQVFQACDAFFTYPLDDTYIHMAVAKNLANRGAWSLDLSHFTPCTSSLLWPALLGLTYWVTGIHDITPFILNIICAVAVLCWVWREMILDNRSKLMAAIVLLCVIGAAPLTTLVFVSMEHTLHILLIMMFICVGTRLIRKSHLSVKEAWPLFLLAPLNVLARYEGGLIIGMLGLMMLVRRQWLPAVLMGICAVLPTTLYGLYSLMNGWYFLPNSIIIKSNFVSDAWLPTEERSRILSRIIDNRTVLISGLIPLALAMLYCARDAAAVYALRNEMRLNQQRSDWKEQDKQYEFYAWVAFRKRILHPEVMAGYLFALPCIIHYLIIDMTLFSRYDGYLTATSVLLTAKLWPRSFAQVKSLFKALLPDRTRAIILGTVFVLMLPWIFSNIIMIYQRALGHSYNIAPAASNIYDQQVQMARFIKTYYNGRNIALNDIGAVNYYADVYCLDLWGLASMDSALAKYEGRFNQQFLDEVTRKYNTDVVMAYLSWIGNPPERWQNAGAWSLQENYICGSPTVSIFAANPDGIGQLINNLDAYSNKLSPRVIQFGPYIDALETQATL